MIICERNFERPDPQDPRYSMHEVDYYAWIPYHLHKLIGDHRLSIRKNLVTGEFEVYRHYHRTGKDEVIFSGDFEDALEIAHHEVIRFHGDHEKDVPCQHRRPNIDIFCEARMERGGFRGDNP